MAQINKPSDYFQTKLYTGNGTDNHAITGLNFSPNWTWIKNRGTAHHMLYDSVRGATKAIFSHLTSAENTSSGHLKSFDSDGFTLGDNSGTGSTNGNTETYFAHNWKAGGTASSNTDGSITSSVSASTASGFSIVSYVGTGATATVGHGLGAVPKMIIVKDRDASANWNTYHVEVGNAKTVQLNTSNAESSTSSWNSTTPTSSVFSLGAVGAVNTSGNNYIAYCFAEKKGFSRIGSYYGNNSTDGTFVNTMMKPAFTLIKNASGAFDWLMQDSTRQADANFIGNPVNILNQANANNSESNASTRSVDYLSNGFKIRNTSGAWNTSGNKFIYISFAEQPLVGTNNIPSTGV